MTIDYSQIFRIGEDGIYYQGGITLYFEFCKDKDGFAGEQIFCDGKFLVKFYSQSDFTVEFNINSFKNEVNRIKSAREKCSSFLLFLEEKGVFVKSL
jgi:hypothetical protein